METVSLSMSEMSLRSVHRANFPGCQVWTIAEHELLVAEYPNADASGKWTGPSRLLVVRESDGHTVESIDLPSSEQVNAASFTPEWLVWQTGPVGGTGLHQIWAENRQTGHRRLLMTAPKTGEAGDIVGLKIVGDTAYWLSNVQIQDDMVSTVWSCSLTDGVLRPLVREDAARDGRAILSMAVGTSYLWYAEAMSKNPMDPRDKGSLKRLSLANPKSAPQQAPISLWHPPVLYGATDGAAYFEENAQTEPNSPVNPAPYPIYAYPWGSRTLLQWTNRQTGVATVGGEWMVVNQNGDKGQAVLYHLSTRTASLLPAPFGVTDGQDVAWWDGEGHVGWASLV